MRYKGSVYRPPSEAYSLIVQVTYGCSHNTCAFCSMYKEKHFAIRPLEEVLEDFRIARGVYRRVDRVFLADGDALVRKANELYTILDTIRELFPECERVTSYASPASIRIRTEEELRTLRDKGLTMVYMGLESGCDDVLKRMRKGHMSAEIVEMGRKVRRCGMALSVTAITGLGGPELLERHAIETAEYLVMRQPFPGPGLAIRVIGEVTKDKLDTLRLADFIFRDEIAKAHLEGTMNQYFAVLTNMRSVGVMGDGRTYDYTLALRSVTTTDFMTADWTRIPYEVLDRISVRIVNEVPHINRIVYDITSKPPATIEWE